MSGEAEKYFPLLYDELRRLARSRLASGGRNTVLDTHALLHESFLRLQNAGHLVLNDREHFLAYAATTMRSIVVDHLRRRRALRRGGDISIVTLNTVVANELGSSEDEVLDIHDALETLGQVEPRLVQVVEMRYFAGLSEAEIAQALGVTDRTVRRDWERARLLLAGMLGR
jgi:RNA polymerase sigma factor (TIGR02999 family)